MPHLLDVPWLWLFGALSLGIFAGWLTYVQATTQWNDRLGHIAFGAVALGLVLLVASLLPARYGGRLELGLVLAVISAIGCYLLATTQWNDRPLGIAIGAAAVGILLLIAKMIPAHYGFRLELGLTLAAIGAVGCFIGWALRNLADYTPVARAEATASAMTAGSYLYRDAFAGMGTSPAYMRATSGHGGPSRVQRPPNADDLAQAPAPGGYTFPKTLPFADATTSRVSEAGSNRRRHWTWSA